MHPLLPFSLQAFAEQLQGALQACERGEGYDIILDALGGMYFKVFQNGRTGVW